MRQSVGTWPGICRFVCVCVCVCVCVNVCVCMYQKNNLRLMGAAVGWHLAWHMQICMCVCMCECENVCACVYQKFMDDKSVTY
jgi:hypothetical protein